MRSAVMLSGIIIAGRIGDHTLPGDIAGLVTAWTLLCIAWDVSDLLRGIIDWLNRP